MIEHDLINAAFFVALAFAAAVVDRLYNNVYLFSQQWLPLLMLKFQLQADGACVLRSPCIIVGGILLQRFIVN